MLRSLLLTTTFALAVSTAPALAQTPPECVTSAPDARLEAVLAKADRPADQRDRDAARRPEVSFLLAHIKPGDHVLDIGAGGGYASWLMSTAVCNGQVVSQNPPAWVEGFKMGPARDAMVAARPNIAVMTADFTALTAPAQPYDAIFMGMVYHDTYNNQPAGYDGKAFVTQLKSHLKPGGIVIITDHDTAAGIGIDQTNTLHRIEKARVIADFTAAGFVLAEDNASLESAGDDHTKNVFDPAVRGKTDRMALVFKKP